MNRLTSKASWTILPNTIRTGVWLSVAKAGALWKLCNASRVNLGSLVPVTEGGCSNSVNLSATIIRDIEEARESIEIKSGLVLMNWDTMLLVC